MPAAPSMFFPVPFQGNNPAMGPEQNPYTSLGAQFAPTQAAPTGQLTPQAASSFNPWYGNPQSAPPQQGPQPSMFDNFMHQALYGNVGTGGTGVNPAAYVPQGGAQPAPQGPAPPAFAQAPQWNPAPYQAGPYDSMLQQIMTSQQNPANNQDSAWLRQFVQGGAGPVDGTPAWQAMVEAQQGNIDRQAGNLNEFFNTMGGRFSTAYGDAMQQFHGQAAKDQNATLSMMQTQLMDNARARQLAGGSTLAGLTQQGESDSLMRQLQAAMTGAGMNNQRYMQNNSYQYGLENQFRGHEFAANMYNAQAADTSAASLAQMAAQASQQLAQNSSNAAQLLFGGQTGAMNNLFGGQQQGVANWANMNMAGQQMNNSTAGMLEQLMMGNLGLGGNLGGQQFSSLQQQINAGYQEWIRQQPQYNPMMQMMFQGGMTPQGMYFPQYQQTPFQQIMQFIGPAMAAASRGGV